MPDAGSILLTEMVGWFENQVSTGSRDRQRTGLLNSLHWRHGYSGGHSGDFFPEPADFKEEDRGCHRIWLLSGLPLVFWYVRNWIVAGSTTNRVFAIHWPKKGNFLIGVDTITVGFCLKQFQFKFVNTSCWLA